MTERRAKGEVQRMVLDFVNASEPTIRHTPYGIAKALGLSAGSAHATCAALVRDKAIRSFGVKPVMVGKLPEK